MHFGEHLMIDGYGGNYANLNDKNIVLSAMNDLVSLLGMRMLAEPQIYNAPENNVKDPGGWSGFVVIQESHISVHTFPARGFLSSDVYTCKNGLDTELIKSYIKEKFNMVEIETNFVQRGTHYPDHNINV